MLDETACGKISCNKNVTLKIICTDIGAINQLLFPLCKAAALLKFLDSTDAIIN